MLFKPQTGILETTCREEVTIAFAFTYFDHQVSGKRNLFTPRSWPKQKIHTKKSREINTTFKKYMQKRLLLKGNTIGYPVHKSKSNKLSSHILGV